MSGKQLLTRGLTVAVTALGLLLLARLSTASVRSHGVETSVLRLSWSARPERIETCRVLSQEELEELLEHMRRRVQCEGKAASYLFAVTVDGVRIREQVVRGAGLRNDRAMYLLEDLPVKPGKHDIQLSLIRRERNDREGDDREGFGRGGDDRERSSGEKDDLNEDDSLSENPARSGARADTGLFAGRADRERIERARLARAAIAPRISLDTTVTFSPGRVLLITIVAGSNRFQILPR